MFDKNAAIEAYSAPFGNNAKRLDDYCRAVGFDGDIEPIAESIRQIQDKIFDEIWRRSDVQRLTHEEMIAITRQYLNEHEPWVSEMGVSGLLQWIAWMSWHEGCVIFPEAPDENKHWWQFWKA